MFRISKLHTVIVILANAYLEIACADYDLPEIHRHWTIRRTVDYRHVVWG